MQAAGIERDLPPILSPQPSSQMDSTRSEDGSSSTGQGSTSGSVSFAQPGSSRQPMEVEDNSLSARSSSPLVGVLGFAQSMPATHVHHISQSKYLVNPDVTEDLAINVVGPVMEMVKMTESRAKLERDYLSLYEGYMKSQSSLRDLRDWVLNRSNQVAEESRSISAQLCLLRGENKLLKAENEAYKKLHGPAPALPLENGLIHTIDAEAAKFIAEREIATPRPPTHNYRSNS